MPPEPDSICVAIHESSPHTCKVRLLTILHYVVSDNLEIVFVARLRFDSSVSKRDTQSMWEEGLAASSMEVHADSTASWG